MQDSASPKIERTIMATYIIVTESTTRREYEIEASSAEEARDIWSDDLTTEDADRTDSTSESIAYETEG
jgi:hypothetical protein